MEETIKKNAEFRFGHKPSPNKHCSKSTTEVTQQLTTEIQQRSLGPSLGGECQSPRRCWTVLSEAPKMLSVDVRSPSSFDQTGSKLYQGMLMIQVHAVKESVAVTRLLWCGPWDHKVLRSDLMPVHMVRSLPHR